MSDKVRVTAFCVDLAPARGCGVSNCPTYLRTVVVESSDLAALVRKNDIVHIGLEVVEESDDT